MRFNFHLYLKICFSTICTLGEHAALSVFSMLYGVLCYELLFLLKKTRD